MNSRTFQYFIWSDFSKFTLFEKIQGIFNLVNDKFSEINNWLIFWIFLNAIDTRNFVNIHLNKWI